MKLVVSRLIALVVLVSFFVVIIHYGGKDAPWYAWTALCVLCFFGMFGSAWMLKSSYDTSSTSQADSSTRGSGDRSTDNSGSAS